MQKAINATFYWIWVHSRTFMAACISAGILAAIAGVFVFAGGPQHVATVQAGVVVESSRDINETPMAVVELAGGGTVFVPGTHVAGESVPVALDARGDVITTSPAMYWFITGLIAFVGGIFGFLAALFAYAYIDESSRVHQYQWSRAPSEVW
jgi:drug/metabolite transporter (DMT)-like permease